LEHIIIIGGGVGGAVAHDLVLRGYQVTLVERGELMSGTTGRHHGLLHSGARYILHDPATAHECFVENQILRKIAPEAIEPNDGLFVALNAADMDQYNTFVAGCREAGIPVRPLTVDRALTIEPELNPQILAALQVPDATMDAWRLPLHFFATAKANGARIYNFTEVIDLQRNGQGVTGVKVIDHRTQRIRTLGADIVVNAAGPWAGRIAAMAGLEAPVRPGPGVMVSVAGRLTNMVINRLHIAGSGDIVVPQRNLTIMGTTAWLAGDPDDVALPPGHVQKLLTLGGELVPRVAQMPPHAVWWASRPLLEDEANDDPMRISRTFACWDHRERDGVEGMVSLIGGKATTMRAMAEETADLICHKVGRRIACQTRTTPLLPYRRFYG
jgi:glycerol-3-phosphate dehydrogenase